MQKKKIFLKTLGSEDKAHMYTCTYVHTHTCTRVSLQLCTLEQLTVVSNIQYILLHFIILKTQLNFP